MRKLLVCMVIFLSGCCINRPSAVLYHDFTSDSRNWACELERGGAVRIEGGEMDVDVPAGATVWFRPILHSPVRIDYDATPISAGGANDRASDLNCYWMARDSRNVTDLFAVHRSGKFADYNALLTYYASIGGNSNTTTRFRRYIGSATTRPLLPEHDLRDPADMLFANVTIHITLITDGRHIEFRRDGKSLFVYDDRDPYTCGNFAFRTTQSHFKIRNFCVMAIR